MVNISNTVQNYKKFLTGKNIFIKKCKNNKKWGISRQPISINQYKTFKKLIKVVINKQIEF